MVVYSRVICISRAIAGINIGPTGASEGIRVSRPNPHAEEMGVKQPNLLDLGKADIYPCRSYSIRKLSQMFGFGLEGDCFRWRSRVPN